MGSRTRVVSRDRRKFRKPIPAAATCCARDSNPRARLYPREQWRNAFTLPGVSMQAIDFIWLSPLFLSLSRRASSACPFPRFTPAECSAQAAETFSLSVTHMRYRCAISLTHIHGRWCNSQVAALSGYTLSFSLSLPHMQRRYAVSLSLSPIRTRQSSSVQVAD